MEGDALRKSLKMKTMDNWNKRGQEGPNWLLITLVIGGVVALIAILFFTGVFDKMGQAKDALPGQLSFKQSSCETVLKQELIAGACMNSCMLEIIIMLIVLMRGLLVG